MKTKQNQSYSALCRAISFAGTQVALAKLLKTHDEKISQPHIQKWLKSPIGVPAEHCVSIESETPITRKELRPDDWQKFWPELAADSSNKP
jgi:DNA-binding transcriptional regulator YdaS (Cro superfamily)